VDDLLDFLHLLGAAVWLGGLVTLAVVVVVAYRSLERDAFRLLVRRAGWAFAGLSLAAWLLLAASGLALAFGHGWPPLAVAKAILGGGVILAAVAHVFTGRRRDSRPLVLVSRTLSLLIFAATLTLFWLGVRLAA
jgi:uncharacterized membrane protein